MIAPMKKFFLVVLDKDMRGVPHQLRSLGIVHIESFQSSGASCAALETSKKNALNAKGVLASYADKKTAPHRSDAAAETVIGETLARQANLNALRDRLAELKREKDRIESWGDFSPELLTELKSAGLHLHLFECPSKRLGEIAATREYFALASPKGRARILLLGPEPAPEGFVEFKPSAASLTRLRHEISAGEKSVEEESRKLAALAGNLPTIEKELRRLESALILERLRAGLPQEGAMRYLSGYVPAASADILKAEAARRDWALGLDDPSDEDLPPTKVENPPAIRIIQPVFDFLGTVPNYREYDISAWFLGFFALYFAMIFGDGGYGLIMLGGAFAMLVRSRKARRPLSDFTKLLFVLSGTTVIWGFVTATWFALPFEALPQWLRSLSVPALNGANPEAGTNTKIFCFFVGAIQLAIAHLKNIKRDFPDLKFLAQVGSLLMVIGMLDAVLNLVIDASRFPLYGWALACIGVGFALTLVFGSWNGNLLRSLLEGLKGIIPSFLGMVSVFADIVSYIRLWAVGLAGLAISQTVNGMAIAMLGPAAGRLVAFLTGGLIAVLLLFIGHGINLLMSLLSVIVHGIRLNVLEFSSHLGMEWSGYKYEPLSEPAEERKAQENSI